MTSSSTTTADSAALHRNELGAEKYPGFVFTPAVRQDKPTHDVGFRLEFSKIKVRATSADKALYP